MRTLVGAPPFEFLLRSDEGVLNPSGIGARRKHMAHDEEVVTPYGSFCRGHYEDSLGRLYKIISRRKAPRAEPWEPLTSGDMVVVDVRLHRHNFRKKLELLRGDHGSVAQAAAQFPKPGSSVRLRRTAAFDAIEGMGGADQEVRLAVRNGRIPKPGGVVARLVADVASRGPPRALARLRACARAHAARAPPPRMESDAEPDDAPPAAPAAPQPAPQPAPHPAPAKRRPPAAGDPKAARARNPYACRRKNPRTGRWHADLLSSLKDPEDVRKCRNREWPFDV